ncbi:MAG: parkin coregulated gene family protein [archaeon]|nr:parkin coregulated gene family protein [archaeon]
MELINANNCKLRTTLIDFNGENRFNYSIPLNNKNIRSMSQDFNIKSKRPIGLKKRHILARNTFTSYKPFSILPSKRLKVRVMSPFLNNKNYKTNFAYVYASRGIPCHLQNNNFYSSLKWEKGFSEIDYQTVLPLCFEGLIEIVHPYKTAAREACRDLIQNLKDPKEIFPSLLKIFTSVRNALNSKNEDIYLATINILELVRIF